ncbi:MAG: hypothetical protein WC223_04395 [Bacteroidales bacterium]|jgi:outer membrane protein W
MRKIKLLTVAIALFLCYNNTSAQRGGKGEGTVLIDAFYGFPNLWSTVIKTAYENTGEQLNIKIGSTGPFGAKAEYMVSDKMGMGIIFNYANSSYSWNEDSYDINNNPIVYNYKISLPRLRFLASFNFHFGDSESFDPFLVIAAGYSSFNAQATSNDPMFATETIKGLIPVAFRAGFGMRYFFSDNIGINFEIGLGGPAIQGGLSFKI